MRLLTIELMLCVAACGGAAPPAPRADTPAPVEPEPPVPADLLAREWLEDVHRAFHPRWESFVQQARTLLPASHAVNQPAAEVTLRLAVLPSGAVAATTERPSGVAELDQAAREVVTASSPLPAPPEELRSDDGSVYVEWRFAVDARKDGVAGARVDLRRYDVARAVPLLLGRGRVGEALDRIAAEPPTPGGVALAREVAGAILERALLDPREPGLRVEAAEAMGAAGWRRAAPALRRLAQDAPDLALQTAAIRALGGLGDREAAPVLTEAVGRLSGERSAAAAAALALMGESAAVWSVVEPALAVKERRLTALTVLAPVGDKRSVPVLSGILSDRRALKAERVAAATALGAAADDPAGEAAMALQRALADGDAAVRAAAAGGLAAAAGRGVRSRALLSSAIALVTERDPRVRVAAVTAAARLDARGAASDILRASRGGGPGVQAACARGLAEVPGPEALAALSRLAGAPAADVRQAAVAALVRRPEPEAREVAARRVADEDPRVRAASAAALDAAQLRQALLADPSPDVRSAGLGALLVREGALSGLPDALRLLGRAGGGRERVLLAAAFLGATRDDAPGSKQ